MNRVFPLRKFKIHGHSMEPLIPNGATLLINQWIYLFRPPRAGEIVIFENPRSWGEFLCKRIIRWDSASGACEVKGDNPGDSLDSRQFGTIKISQILGKTITAR